MADSDFNSRFFYSYKAILRHHLLVIDISIFIISAVIGQLLSYKIMTLPEFSRKFNMVCLLSLAVPLLAFFVFTYFPPHFFLFKDPIFGQHGIMFRKQ